MLLSVKLYYILGHIEAGYSTIHLEWQFFLFPHQFHVSYSVGKLTNLSTQEMFQIRRLAFAPLMPLKVIVLLQCN